MKPRKEDTFRGTVFSVVLHAALLAALLFSWKASRPTESAGGDAGIEASMVKFGDLPADVQAAVTGAPQPLAGEPLPAPVEAEVEPRPEEALPTPVETTPAPVEPSPPTPENADAPAPVPTPVAKPVKADPVKPAAKTTPDKPPVKPADKKPVETKPASPKTAVSKPTVTPPKPAVPSSKPAGVRNARADALAEMRAEQLKDIEGGGKAPVAGNLKGTSTTGTRADVGKGDASGGSSGNQKRWLDAVSRHIERQWIRPEGIPKDAPCPIRIRIIPGGEVMSASVLPSCPYSAAAKQSVQDAVMKASPLPVKGFENDWTRDFTVNFYPSR